MGPLSVPREKTDHVALKKKKKRKKKIRSVENIFKQPVTPP